jgi:hypothetical protein
MAYQAMQQVYRSTYGIHVKRGILATLIAQKKSSRDSLLSTLSLSTSEQNGAAFIFAFYGQVSLRRGLSGFDIYFRIHKGYYTIF